MLIVTVLFLVMGGGIYSWRAVSSEPKKQVTAKSLKEINEEIDKANVVLLSGKVEPKLVSKVFLNQERGKVASLDVNEGDTVKKGQKLFSYTNSEGDLAMKEAELAVRKEASTLEQKRTELNQKYTMVNQVVVTNPREELLKSLVY